jgi:putative FmdB family regulatory protein
VPLYEYQCPQCGKFELIRKFSDNLLTACPTCGSEVHKLPSAPAIQFKGTGWYITDYARKSSGGETGGGKAGEGKTSEGKSGEGKSGEGKSGEGKSGEGKSGEGKAKSDGGDSSSTKEAKATTATASKDSAAGGGTK